MLFERVAITVNADEKAERDNAKSIFKNEVKLIIDRKAFISKLMIIK